MAFIPTSVPAASPVTPGQFEVGFPPRASAPALFGAQLNAFLGWRGLRDGCRHHQLGGADVDQADDPGYAAPPRIELHRGPVSNTFWVGISLLAVQPLSGDPPEVTIRIETGTEELVDGPIVWSFDSGFLPPSPAQLDDVVARAAEAGVSVEEAWATFWRDGGQQADRWVTTGWGRTSVLEDPRLLDPDGPDVDEPLFLVVESTAVRIYSVTWAEGWQPVLPDA